MAHFQTQCKLEHRLIRDFAIIRYFGRKPTSVNSESNVRIGESAMPWESVSEDGKVYKYQYHPHGDKSQPLRAAPSAMNTVIVPNVTLPEVCPIGFSNQYAIPDNPVQNTVVGLVVSI